MRILLNSLNYFPEATGIGKYSGDMAAWLAARGHQVDVVAAPPYYPQWRVHDAYRPVRYREEHQHGVRVLRAPLWVPERRGASTAGRLALETSFTLASVIPWLRLGLRARRHDVVVAVVPPLQTSILPLVYATVRRTPLVLHVQDLQVDAAMQLGFFRRVPWVARLLHALEVALLRRATKVTTVSEPMRRRIVQKGLEPSRVGLFPNWADVSAIRPLPRENPVRTALGLSAEDILVLYSGNMGRKQGLDIVLDAAAALAGERRIVFGLVGNGADRARLEASARSRGLANVLFRDLVPWSDVPELLAAGDVHVIPQMREAADLLMPSKLANIMAAGRPVVATCDQGTALYAALEESGGGRAVEPGASNALAKAILELAYDDTARSELGANGRRYAEDRLAKERVLLAFERTLEDLRQAATASSAG